MPKKIDNKEAIWSQFDKQWYQRFYSEVLNIITIVYGGNSYLFYKERGCKIGHSPNMFFDEQWYLRTYPDVVEDIKHNKFVSGFDHYQSKGYTTYSPHWLFSEEDYRKEHSQLADEIATYVNAYDHYLQKGHRFLSSENTFFNPVLYLSQQENAVEIWKDNSFTHCLASFTQSNRSIQLSWFFDEEWYLNTYPEVKALIAGKKVQSGLHHYLFNETPLLFSPNPYFSEEFYTSEYPDVALYVNESGKTRSGYAHFLSYGLQEKRLPNKDFDFQKFYHIINQRDHGFDSLYTNDFDYWLSRQNITLAQKYEDTYKKFFELVKNYKENNTMFPSSSLEATGPSTCLIECDEEKKTEALGDTVSFATNVKTNGDEDLNTVGPKNDHPVNANSLTCEVIQELVSEAPKNHLQNELGDRAEQVELFTLKTDLSWKQFDEEWYIGHYRNVTSKMMALELESVEEYYRSFGCYEGHSPNAFFDEQWYVRTYPDVKCLVNNRTIRSGFEHYCQKGFQTHSPHWLFSEQLYKHQNPELNDNTLQKMGFLNGYDHYLKTGDVIGLNGSFFFDSSYFAAHYGSLTRPGYGPYAHYVKFLLEENNIQAVSWYFDPEWYLKEYQDVKILIDEKKFFNPLHHYLTNETPNEYSPLYWFDEHFYLSTYFDENSRPLLSKTYRTGYDHFLSEGVLNLYKPKSTVDLVSYSGRQDVKENIQQGLCSNIFLHWLSHGTENGNNLTKASESSKSTEDADKPLSSLPISQKVKNAAWFEFDEKWYLRKYPNAIEKMKGYGIKNLQHYYQDVDCVQGCSPNAYFDESWYLKRYPLVKKMIEKGDFKTGFEHYCSVGFKTNDPHWLFSNKYYLRFNPQVIWEIDNSSQFANAYDYFLKVDDQNRKTGSVYFDPTVYEQYCFEKNEFILNNCPFQSYIRRELICNKESNTSLYFDTRWYLERYPDVNGQIEKNEFSCALEHYLTNITPTQYDPSKWFSEDFYLTRYADVKICVADDGSGVFRNGYFHFVEYGVFELRRPSNDLDLKDYYEKNNLKTELFSKQFRDAYAYWVYENRLNEWLDRHRDFTHYHPSQEIEVARANFKKKTQNSLIQHLRHKMSFAYDGEAEITVIMVVCNQFALTLSALNSVRSNFNGKIQLLLGDNHSTDETQHIEDFLIGAEIEHFPYNYGFGRACNELISRAKGPITVFLNNDIQLYPDALSILSHHLLSDTTIGAVGGKIIHPHGVLQEAGSFIWRDGSTLGYLRGENPNVPEANFIREVDYCSAAMLAVKTALLIQLEGFSPNYFPAYFEDTDLCVRIIKAGYKVVYHPDAMVEHLEYASSNPIVSDGLTQRHRYQFVKDHIEFLKYQYPRHDDNIVFARQRLGKTKKILFIEDKIPLGNLGSGFVRSYDIVLQMVDLGYFVTVFPINFHSISFEFYKNYPATIEIIYNRTIEDIEAFFRERSGFYDLMWIGRTHNLARIFPMIEKANRFLPLNRIVLDTEAVAAPRTHQRAKLLEIDLHESFNKTLEIELAFARYCQTIIAVNAMDAQYIETLGFSDVKVLGHCMDIRPTPKNWDERKNILFVGALHDELSPNFDSLEWFIGEVFPLLMDLSKGDIELTIAGYVHPSVNLLKLALYPQIKFLGPVQNLKPLFDDYKIFVAPTRFAGGIPYKVQEAASYGLPIVASEILVQQLNWQDEQEILSASISEPQHFAAQIMKLYTNQELWNKIRENALLRIENDCDTLHFRENLREILNDVISTDLL